MNIGLSIFEKIDNKLIIYFRIVLFFVYFDFYTTGDNLEISYGWFFGAKGNTKIKVLK